MPEYIERESALKIVADMMCDCKVTHKGRSIRRNIKQIPTVDVVEVVRCKDCEHRYVPHRCALWYGTNNGNEYFIERGDDFFCSYAEKKEGAEE